MGKFNVSKTTDECIKWIRNWFEENGKDCNAVIGISGGKDSTICAKLCCEAIGKEHVIGVLMPNGDQADIKSSYACIKELGIRQYTVNIADMFTDVIMGFTASGIGLSKQAVINLPPRLRMSILYAVSQSNNGRVVNTCNLSEDYVGYSTRYGDSAGDFSPLGDLTVSEVLQIGDYLELPYGLVHKTPSDGLSGASDEDNLGFSYNVLDNYIRTGNIEDEETKIKIDEMHRKNLFKLELMPKFSL